MEVFNLSEYLQNVAASEGIGIVTGSGNEADKRHHYLGILEQENNQPVEINVGNNTRGFVMELWTELPNLLALSIESPTGQTIGPVSLRRGIGEYVFVFEQTRVIFNYRVLVEDDPGRSWHFFSLTDREAESGRLYRKHWSWGMESFISGFQWKSF